MLPWVLVLVLGVTYWLVESLMHMVVFGNGSFATNVLSPPIHEVWMRGAVIVMMLLLAGVSGIAIRQRSSRIGRLTMYQERLREMISRLAEADDDERRQLGERLHEQVAQTLTGAGLFLAGVQDCEPARAAAVRSAERIVARAIADCREIAAALSPPVLREYGLAPAVEEFGRRISRRTGIPVATQVDGELNLNSHQAELSFRAISDIVLTAVSDPRTTRVSVAISEEGPEVDIDVEWDAFTADEFFEIRERVSAVGGVLRVAGSLGGAHVVVSVPTGSRS